MIDLLGRVGMDICDYCGVDIYNLKWAYTMHLKTKT